MSKHEEIIKYIDKLKIGAKISVRSISNELGVSEGTAYRAIKDAENLGIANTIPRVGTIRIEKLKKRNIEKLTFLEVVNIVEGLVIGGSEGLSCPLNNFVIGAMTMESMEKYFEEGNLLIVGDREEAQISALKNGCAVLVTGGFKCSQETKKLADDKKLPLISCTYDTFTTATMLNKAIAENLVKKDVITIENIMKTDVISLKVKDTVKIFKDTVRRTKHGKFPILDDNNRLVGMFDYKDLPTDISDKEHIFKIMNKDIITLEPKTSVAYAAHIMTWEGLELIPITDGKNLIGVASRYDVLKALQQVNKQPQVGETIDDVVIKSFNCINIENGLKFYGRIDAQMLDNTGFASWSALTLLMSNAGIIALRKKSHINVEVDSFTVFYIKPIQLDVSIIINVKVINIGKNLSKVEIEIIKEDNNELIGKAILSARVIRK